MKRFLSYIYPVTKTIASKYNGTLEITWYNGVKHLNSKNANYSYGSLQRILKFGLEQIDLSKLDSILILGMGGGSVISTLQNDFKYQKHITAVEIDPVIIDVAKTEFGIIDSDSLKIICEDAHRFMEGNTIKFDLIIIDLFIDLNVPNEFLETTFWKFVLTSISSKGYIVFNAAVKDAKNAIIKNLIAYLKTKIYKVDVFENVNNTNTLIIASVL